jgi:TonB family protein
VFLAGYPIVRNFSHGTTVMRLPVRCFIMDKSMRCSAPLAAILSASILFAAPVGLRAQTADLPPAPSAPVSSKPVFQVPLGTPVTIASPKGPPPPTPDVETDCYAAAEGIYAKQKPLTAAQQKAVDAYQAIAVHQLEIAWDRHMPRAAYDPWVKGKVVVVRFAIMPDGTIDTPIITLSSGRRSYDNHALDAISAVVFPPMPEGVKRPLPVCMHFGYNTDPLAKKPAMPDLWPPPAKPEPKKQPSEDTVNPPASSPSGSQPK